MLPRKTFLPLALGLVLLALTTAGAVAKSPPPSPSPSPTGAKASFSPSTLTFAPQDVGTTSPSQVITLSNTGTSGLFINGEQHLGTNPLDFNVTDDQCVGTTIAVGGSCTLTIVFNPTATGARTATLSVTDNAPGSPHALTFNGTGVSAAGPTPLAVATGGMTCTGGVCELLSSLVNDFYYTSFGVAGDTAPPFTWSLAGGTLPPGLTLSPSGALSGTTTATGDYTFTLQVTDGRGQTATQAFHLPVSPVPAPGNPACQHAPSSSTAALSGPAIGGVTPSGHGLGDQSKLTACGGFVTITAVVKNVNLPTGTVLYVTVGRVVGTIKLSNGSGSMKPFVLNSDLRKKSMQVYAQPPAPGVNPILTGPFL
jgi:Putative Ig domain/Abnormal spindle-like microcephaly-assoc'd, ASPM-SPD-2-Hydin